MSNTRPVADSSAVRSLELTPWPGRTRQRVMITLRARCLPPAASRTK